MKNRDFAYKGFNYTDEKLLATKWDIDDSTKKLELTEAKKN